MKVRLPKLENGFTCLKYMPTYTQILNFKMLKNNILYN